MARRTTATKPATNGNGHRPRGGTSTLDALTAAAAAYDITSRVEIERVRKLHEDWQDLAWAYFDTIGEIKYAANFRGNAVSKIRLYAGVTVDPEREPVPALEAARPADPVDGDDDPQPAVISDALARAAVEELARLDNADDGTPGLLRRLAVNLTVPGEAWLVGQELDGVGEQWSVLSDAEIEPIGPGATAGWKTKRSPADKDGTKLPKDAVVRRVWRPHARWYELADSDLRGVLEVCEELTVLSRSIGAAAKSRLFAGILLYNKRKLGPVPGDNTHETDKRHPVVRDIEEASMIPIGEPGAASAVTPLAVELDLGPDETFGDVIQHLKWERPIDAEVIERCEHLLTRLAQGLDVPPEVLTGVADVNHWSAWQIEESTFKAHIEPLVVLICSGLTTAFLRDMLRARGAFAEEEIRKIVVWYDATDLVAKPNRLDTATKGYEMRALSGEAWRREADFAESDAPTTDELAQRLGVDRSILTAEISLQLLKLAGIVPPDTQLAVLGEETPAPVDDEETDEPPTQGPPPGGPPEAGLAAAGRRRIEGVGSDLAAVDTGLRDRLLAAADAAVDRALERAGARLRSRANRDAAARAAIDGVGAHLVAATLGPALCAALLQVDTDDPDVLAELLLAGSFDQLATRWEGWVRRAQDEVVAIATDASTLEPTEDQRAEWRATQEQQRAAGWETFVGLLTTLAATRLFTPTPAGPEPGEFDPTLTVPASLVREAMAVAGGATNLERSAVGGLWVDGTSRPPGGVATGDTARAVFEALGMTWDGYTWLYGDPSSRAVPFEPHRRLAGRFFATFDSPALDAAGVEWIGSLTLAPGDHRGCRCDFAPSVVRTEV